MPLTIYFDHDLNLELIKNRRIAVVGYGAQGRAHALNLRDASCRVKVGQRAGAGFEQAVRDGFEPVSISEAVADSDFVCLMLPDEIQGVVFDEQIAPHLNPDDVVLCCHGFSLLYETVKPPTGVASLLVAPKGAGHRVRSAFEEGGGVACLAGVGPGVDRADYFPLALAYAGAIGGGRAGILETDVREETETDLFGEQAILCGGVSHLAIAAFETLVEAGYREEVAYFECVHELKLVVDLLHRGGLAFMREHISNTAEYGDYTRGPRVIDAHVRENLKAVLEDIQSGRFAREWMEETHSGSHNFQAQRSRQRAKSIERAGASLRQQMKLG